MMYPFTINIRGKIFDYTHPAVMGIINITPDSFYGESRLMQIDAISERAAEMISQGADMIDIGAYSTRPGCKDVSVDEELHRLDAALEGVRRVAPGLPVSVDTFRAEVARRAVTEMSADIVNDISGGSIDPAMMHTVADLHVPFILTHSRGGIDDMHKPTVYDDLLADVVRELAQRVVEAQLLGINDIIIDPGFGFSKDKGQNFRLLDNLDVLQSLHKPILVGISRKSMICKTLDVTPEQALNGTTVLNTIAVLKGASILRVHDVNEARQVIALTEALATKQ